MHYLSLRQATKTSGSFVVYEDMPPSLSHPAAPPLRPPLPRVHPFWLLLPGFGVRCRLDRLGRGRGRGALRRRGIRSLRQFRLQPQHRVGAPRESFLECLCLPRREGPVGGAGGDDPLRGREGHVVQGVPLRKGGHAQRLRRRTTPALHLRPRPRARRPRSRAPTRPPGAATSTRTQIGRWGRADGGFACFLPSHPHHARALLLALT